MSRVEIGGHGRLGRHPLAAYGMIERPGAPACRAWRLKTAQRPGSRSSLAPPGHREAAAVHRIAYQWMAPGSAKWTRI